VKLLEHQKLKSLALWVKGNAKAINVFAGIFFLLTFLSGLAWVAGANIEPVAFVLGLCSSSLFGLPHLAEFILPSRKPVKDMTHDELLAFVKSSHPKNDWKGVSKTWMSEVFLKEDPRLRFRAKHIEDGIQNEDYKDEWANRHPDPHAAGYWYDLYYDGNLIERFILVSVDGGRANLSPPNWQTGKIDMMGYKVAQIHDLLGMLDEYIKRSGLDVDKNT
jgi:hypothetical protein